MVSIDIQHAFVDFPIFDAKSRSLKKAVLGKAGGKIGTDSRVPIIEALRDINLNLRQGARSVWSDTTAPASPPCCGLMSGIYEPTRGSTLIQGKVAPVFEPGRRDGPGDLRLRNIMGARAVPGHDPQADAGPGR